MSYATITEALTSGTGVERSFLCPVHDDHNASASVNSLNGLWICYTCGARGKADMDRMEIDPYQVQRMCIKALDTIDVTIHTIYPQAWLGTFDASGPGEYWLNRFTPKTCAYFRLGTTDLYPTIPMRDNDGNVLGVIKRSAIPARKYVYPYGVNVGNYIFDIHRQDQNYLVVTEGPTDAMASWEVGIPAIALYGSRFSDAQAAQIRKYYPEVVYSAHDQDEDGEKAYERLSWGLYPHIQVRRLHWTGYKDLAEMDLSTRRSVLARVAEEDLSRVLSRTCSSPTSSKSTTKRFRIGLRRMLK
jgi:Toprim-like/CHC2 zinc finger